MVVVTLRRSAYGPTYQAQVGGSVRGREVRATLGPFYVGLDDMTPTLVAEIVTESRVVWEDGGHLPHGALQKVRAAVLDALQGVES